MSGYVSTIAEIETILKSATGVVNNNVFKAEKLTKDWATYLSSFKDVTNSVIHAYIIKRTKIESIPEASRVNEVATTWKIMGFYGYKWNDTFTSSSEYKFNVIIDAIRTKFRDDPGLNNSVLTTTPIQLDIFEEREFGEVLCHYAEMRLGTTEQESFS